MANVSYQDAKLTTIFNKNTREIKKVEALAKHLQVITVTDLWTFYPSRYIQQSHYPNIQSIEKNPGVVIIYGCLSKLQVKLTKTNKKYLQGIFQDQTGYIQLIWFKKIQWFYQYLKAGSYFSITGHVQEKNGIRSIIHPSITFAKPNIIQNISPIYPQQDILKKYTIHTSWIQQKIIHLRHFYPVIENLPHYILKQYHLMDRPTALHNIHHPKNKDALSQARTRLKFEELFYLQLHMLMRKRRKKKPAPIFSNTYLLKKFYTTHLPFTLTHAQKKGIKSIYQKMKSGYQMHALLQGDVGSGKTIVAFFAMLITIDHRKQIAFMAPTTLLAEQHYQSIVAYAQPLNLTTALLTGNTPTKQRKIILEQLSSGAIDILIGTHALIETKVRFKHLGLAIIDEQHRFGVQQRGDLWHKDPQKLSPHVLIMSATPIPRTLAMTLYGDLDLVTIHDLPLGRIPITTHHFYENQRLNVFQKIQTQIDKGHQAYIIYPLIEASDTLQYKHLHEGVEAIQHFFKKIPLSIVHGKMNEKDKTQEMQKFSQGKTKIMVATTVIEVGIHVANATIILIENAERFGLAQLHQLRGRVGRSQHPSTCYLMTNYKLSQESKARMDIMVKTHNGFDIAQEDLKIRGAGDLMGAQQSGTLHLKIANISTDEHIILQSRKAVQKIIEEDIGLVKTLHQSIQKYITQCHAYNHWANIG